MWVVVIVNDMSELNIDFVFFCFGGKLIKWEGDVFVEFFNGCICCIFWDDLFEEIMKFVLVGCFDYLFIEVIGIFELMFVVEMFVYCDEFGFGLSNLLCFDVMVIVVDVGVFLVDF